MKKKILSITLLACLSIGTFSSCGLFKKGRCDKCPEFTLEEQENPTTIKEENIQNSQP